MRGLLTIMKAFLIGVVCLMALTPYGCSAVPSGGQSSGQPEPSATQTSAPSPSANSGSADPTATCPASISPTITVSAGELPNGRTFGFVHHFDGVALYVDPAELFTNEAAVKAAREDGEIGPDEDLPNPVYIRNRDSTIVRVPVSTEFVVTVLDNQEMKSHRLASARFAAFYCGTPLPAWLYSDPANLPVHLKVANGLVVRAEEQYLP